MTVQYIVGEFSALLGDLLPVTDEVLRGALHDLRREVEASPVSRLHTFARRAISLAEGICWDTLERGDMSRFCHDVETAIALRQFVVSAKLLPGPWSWSDQPPSRHHLMA